MPVAHPDLRLLRKLLQHALVDLRRPRVVADVGEHRGLEVAIARIARLAGEKLLDVRQRRGRLALAVEHGRQVVAGGIEARGELEAALEECLRIRIAAQPRRNFGQHAQRRDVGRMRLQVLAQQRFGFGNAVLDQRCSRGQQPRIPGGRLDVARVGGVGAFPFADRRKVVGERAPRIGQVRLESHRAAQRGDGRLALPEAAERHAQLVVGRGPAGLLGDRAAARPRARRQRCRRHAAPRPAAAWPWGDRGTALRISAACSAASAGSPAAAGRHDCSATSSDPSRVSEGAFIV